MTSTVYPVGGSFEDWAYAAGWDIGSNAAFTRCYPTVKQSLPTDFFTRDSIEQVRSAVYLIETDYDKDPPKSKYGGRQIRLDGENPDKFQVLKESINDQSLDSSTNGHINRNIRAAMALIDLSKPYIWVLEAKYDAEERNVEVKF